MNLSRLNVVRLLLGFLLTPAVAPVTAIIIGFVVTEERQGECAFGWIVGLTILFGLPASYVCAIVFGVPYVLIMDRMGRLSFWTIMVGALGLWLGLFIALYLWGAHQHGFPFVLGMPAILYLPGMLLGGAAFYGITVRRYGRLASRQRVASS